MPTNDQLRAAVDTLRIIQNETLTGGDLSDEHDIIMRYLDSDVRSIQLPEPRLNQTDDIGESIPFRDLLRLITGEVEPGDTDLGTVALPFSRYTTFNPSKMNHTFKVLAVHKDYARARTVLDRYAPLFDLVGLLGETEPRMIDAIADALQGDITTENVLNHLITKLRDIAGLDEMESIRPALNTALRQLEQLRDSGTVNVFCVGAY